MKNIPCLLEIRLVNRSRLTESRIDRYPAEMKSNQRSRVALITGGGKRLGKETALHLASCGMDVIVHCNRSRSEADEVAHAVVANGCRAAVVQGDLGDIASIPALFARCVEQLGPIAALINSASIFPDGRVLSFSDDDLQENMRVNAMAPLILSRCFAKQSSEAQSIVNILDSHVGEYDARHVPYHLSKRALDAITRMLAVELAPQIRVNAVAPGLILPPVDAPPDYAQVRQKDLPLQKQGSPIDVARAVAFLLENEFITGQTIFVDGGRHLRGSFYG